MYRNKKKIVIGVMIVAALIMVVVYAAFMTRLTINGTGNIASTWNIEITNITSSITGTAYNITEPTYNSTTASFNAGLNKPGDKIEYSITVTNNGTLDAVINEIDAQANGSSAIIYTLEGIQNQEKLPKETSKTFKIIVEFDRNVTSMPSNTTKEIIMNIECIQDTGQTLTPSDPEIEEPILLVNQILSDNIPQSDEKIDFSKTSEEDGTKGLYYTSTNTENNGITYYYRGAVENNYVSFAGFYWRIIRINEDSSIRLIYRGTDLSNPYSAVIGGFFNESCDDNAYVGYMYGTPGSSTYAETHANINDSYIKNEIDTWYEENLLSYSIYLADAGFCGDRSMANTNGLWDPMDTALGYGTNYTIYGSYNRLYNNKNPQFVCPQSNDLYTTASSDKGNKALDYPIGLITADEVSYAGGVDGKGNTSYYLNLGIQHWTISPAAGAATGCTIENDGMLVCGTGVCGATPTVPAINLKSTVEIIEGGTGTSSNPYVIKTN